MWDCTSEKPCVVCSGGGEACELATVRFERDGARAETAALRRERDVLRLDIAHLHQVQEAEMTVVQSMACGFVFDLGREK